MFITFLIISGVIFFIANVFILFMFGKKHNKLAVIFFILSIFLILSGFILSEKKTDFLNLDTGRNEDVSNETGSNWMYKPTDSNADRKLKNEQR